jgi:hypothetical protein
MDEKNRLPEHAYKFFWEIDPTKLDVSRHPSYVIERLLEYGDFPELRWLFSRFEREQIINTLKRTRNLSLRSANFWAKIFHVPSNKVKCLSKQFQQKQNRIWQR